MYIALRLLRDGAHTTITTRFPKDAARRFAAMEDSADWLHRLRIVGIDLRDPSQVMALTDSLDAAGPLDIIINNAAQTVRRSGNAYKPLVDAEDEPLPAALQAANGGPELVTFGHAHDKHPLALASSVLDHPVLAGDAITSLALSTGSASLERIASGTAIDAGGLVPDLATINSWTQVVDEVDPLEMLEVQLCNVTAPFLLVSRLRGAMKRSTARRKYIVNVSAMEGQFSRAYKGPGPPAHEHGQGGAEHDDADQRPGNAGRRRHPHDGRGHRLDHGRAPALHQSPPHGGGLPRAPGPG